MDPLTLSAIIGGASALGGGITNSLNQAGINRRQMAFSREMYDRTRADNLEFWRMQNEYNSPQEQVKRLQAANLNPALMYGGSASGAAGQAGAIPTPDVVSPNLRNPEFGNALSSAGAAYLNSVYSFDIKQAQLDNLKAQNSVLLAEAMLKGAQTAATTTGEERTRFGLDFEREMRDISADARKEQLRQLMLRNDFTINEDARRSATTATNVYEAFERMKNYRVNRIKTRAETTRTEQDTIRIQQDTKRIEQHFENLKKQGVMLDLDNELRKQGINPQDPMWSRIIGRILSNYFTEEGFENTTGNVFDGVSVPKFDFKESMFNGVFGLMKGMSRNYHKK